jgi:hypothetical protein
MNMKLRILDGASDPADFVAGAAAAELAARIRQLIERLDG